MRQTHPSQSPGGRRWLRLIALLVLVLSGAVSGWTWWAEAHSSEERALRTLVQDRLEDWMPEAMSPSRDDWYGLKHLSDATPSSLPRILLVHGLDEPGTIWEALIPALQEQHCDLWELHYPNDQGIDRSTAYLAKLWGQLPDSHPIILIGHSMGGLVIRDFVTAWRHPVGETPRVTGASVAGAILVGTPNHGSDWARLRIWLELREHLIVNEDRQFSLLAALRDGTGAAKIDLRPESDFLNQLNARPWPSDIPIRLIGGVLVDPTPAMTESLATISEQTGSDALEQVVAAWWSTLGEDLGDGVVTVDSLRLPNAPPPILLSASHRGMLKRLLPSDPEPPAVPVILDILKAWQRDRQPDRLSSSSD
ncbi:alpha/beta hydrolase [Thiorhodococcus mannitoliphagus]|uniref:Alpha/beta hydrolase n=1 Tax=Thiorhodococcus mannitoliphagus TaxID=329406 RepID=A0A6P1DN73_9GAMM|nr:alpha/beta hydrolase [Thiorhodococcus mannitoliphagus]NEX18990.1 alpha/beta hydrolase [Thiorhodococcus mannitoliphagus]